MLLTDVPTTIVVASGKGGVGKTFVAVELAKTIDAAGGTVGVLDIDLTTPDSDRAASPETDAGVGNPSTSAGQAGRHVTAGMTRDRTPTTVDGIQIVTKGTELPDYAVNTNDERMQQESAMAFIRGTDWDEGTTHVVVDTPPGTGWEIQTVLRDLRPDAGFIVTTGTENAVRNACRTHELFRRTGLEHAVIANMRTAERTIDREGLRERLTAVEGLDERAEQEAVAVVADALETAQPLHDEGIDLADNFSVPIVADVPFTSNTDRVHEELRAALDGLSLASTIPE